MNKSNTAKINSLSSWKVNLLISLSSLLSIFLLLEIMMRFSGVIKGHSFFSDRYNLVSQGAQSIQPFRMFGFRPYKNKNGIKHISSRHEELFPLKKKEGTFRIVVFGGSSTENKYSYKAAGVHYPSVLQSELRKSLNTKSIEVINVANSAYATPHSLILFSLDVLSWEPDMVIVSHNINDLLAAYWPNLTYDYSNKYSDKFYLPDYDSIYTLPNILFQYSHLYWFIQRRFNVIQEKNSRKKLKRRSYGNQPNPLAIEIFKRNLKLFITIAKDNKIKVLLGNQALYSSEEYFLLHMDNKPYNSVVEYPLHHEFLSHHKIFNSMIKKIAKDNGALFIDNSSKFKDQKEYFIDFVHYSPKGVKILAKNYADFLLDQKAIVVDTSKK